MTVFFIDDDPLVLKSFGRTLKRYQEYFQVYFFSSSRDALEKIEEYAPSLCFTDRKMPWMDGEEFLKRVKEGHPDIYRVLISGDSADRLDPDSYDLFLEKPVSTANLLEIIKERGAAL